MAAEEKLTTIQIDVDTRDKLKELALVYERSMVGELRWLVNQEYLRLRALKLLPEDGKKLAREAPKSK